MKRIICWLSFSIAFALGACVRQEPEKTTSVAPIENKTANYARAVEPLFPKIVSSISAEDAVYSKYLNFCATPDASLARILEPKARDEIFRQFDPAEFSKCKQELRTMVEALPPSTIEAHALRDSMIEVWTAYAILTDDFQSMWDARGLGVTAFSARRSDELKKMSEAGQRFSLLLSDAKKQ